MPGPSSPRVTAVVLNYCRERLTESCVEALAKSDAVVPRILLVDNASPDGSGERLRARFPQHAFLQTGENLGYAGGNAMGIARALELGAEYVLVINDDAEVAPDAVRRLVEALDADPRASAAGPTIVYDDPAATVCWAGGAVDLVRALGTPTTRGGPAGGGVAPTVPESHFDGVAAPQGVRGAADPAAPRACTFVSGCCVLLRASVVRELGSFRSEYFAYVEDVELSVRYARAGWRLLYVPAARVVHHSPWPEPPLAPWKIRLRDLNRRRLVRAHYPAAERARFAVWFYPTRLLRFIAYALAGDGARAAAIWRGMTGTLAGPSRP